MRRGPLSRMSKRDQWIWLAGILEGEGTFTTTSSGYSFRVTLSMSDRDTVNSAATIINAKVWPKKEHVGWKPQFYFEVSGSTAAIVCRKILPYMHSRRRKRIESLLRHWYANILNKNGLELSSDGRRISLNESKYIVG